MSSFNLNHVKPLDDSFFQYLKDVGDYLKEHDSLLHALQDLNTNDNSKIVFINSKCANRGYLCINCKEEEYEGILNNLEEIINLHKEKRIILSNVIASFKE